MANVKKYSKKANGNANISENFKISEFRCNDGSDTILIDKDLCKNHKFYYTPQHSLGFSLNSIRKI